jgi:predicted small lipoprotein YifL
MRCVNVGRLGLVGEFVLVHFRPRFALIAVGIAALALAGCGRNGPLELPPGPATATPTARTQLTQPDGTPIPGSPQDTAMKTGFDAQGRPVAAQGEKKSFILDPLLQ